MRPGYLECNPQTLRQRRQKARVILRACRLCPRQCGVNRLEGERGFCQTGSTAPVASYHLHFGEEVETLAILEGIVDIYMPDLKFAHPDVAERLAGARDYPERSGSAL